jgi:hypothetical protein
MPPEGFEPTIPGTGRSLILTLDPLATQISNTIFTAIILQSEVSSYVY